MEGANVAKVKTKIKWFQGGEVQIYHFEVGLVLNGKIFGDAEQKNRAAAIYDAYSKLVIFHRTDFVVVSHECIHMTIDFFRKLNVDFNQLFSDKDHDGEETFIGIYEQILDSVKRALRRLKKC